MDPSSNEAQKGSRHKISKDLEGNAIAGPQRIRRWEHEAVLDEMERRFEAMPDAMAVRRCTVEHVFGTIKAWMGATHFRTRGFKNVATVASPAILAYNIKRAIAAAGVASTLGDNWVNGVDARYRKKTRAISGAEFSHSLHPVLDMPAAKTCWQLPAPSKPLT
jgi:hypothetical protein